MNQDSDDHFPQSHSVGLIGRVRSGIVDYWSHLKLFSRNARLFLIGSFLMGINMQVFQVLLNLFLKEIGFLEGDIGYIASARAIGMTAMAIPAAMIISRFRLKPFLILGCVAFAVFSYFIVNNDSLPLLIGFSILAGASFSIFRVASGPFFMRNSTPTERTHLFSFSFGSNLLAGMFGAAFAGRLAATLGESTGSIVEGYQITLIVGIAVSLLALIPYLMIKPSEPSREERRLDISWEKLKTRGGFFLKVFVTNFTIGAGAGLIIPFLNLYFRDRFNLPPDVIGIYYSVVHLSMFAGSLSGPVLTKRLGLVRTVVVTQLLSIPFMLTLSYSYVLWLAVAAFVIRGGLMNLGVPIVTNLCMELSKKEEQGLVGALLMIGWTSSWMITTAVGGRLIESFGYTFTMNITIATYVLSSILFYGFFRKTERRNQNSPGWAIIRGEMR